MPLKLFAISALFFFFPFLPLSTQQLHFDLDPPSAEEEGITVNFTDINMGEFLRYVGEVTEANFTYNPSLLDFKISFFTGKQTTPASLLTMTLQLLDEQGIVAKNLDNHYYLSKKSASPSTPSLPLSPPSSVSSVAKSVQTQPPVAYQGKFHTYMLQAQSGKELCTAIQQMVAKMPNAGRFFPELLISIESMQWLPSTNSLLYSGTENGINELTQLIEKLDIASLEHGDSLSEPLALSEKGDSALSLLSYRGSKERKTPQFQVYKLQYHPGKEICSAIQQMAGGMKHADLLTPDLLDTIQSMQWIQATNSLLYSGTRRGIKDLSYLIQSLDMPKKQVFIEVLVIETNLENTLEFGLEWGSTGKYRNKLGYGVGNLNPTASPLANTLRGVHAEQPPKGGDLPFGHGFNLGMIGDLILHKGASYFSMGSLVSALQADGDSAIILNEKVIAQDSEKSTIFTGENIPFFGSVIQIDPTSGGSQQTSNIEYRDIGVKLDITPLIGEGNVITLKIEQSITECPEMSEGSQGTTGIRTTKTDMDAQVHVPDRSFVVLSGMMRNKKRRGKSGIPCLGGLPGIGAAFSKTVKKDDKRSIMIFVYPQLIHSEATYETVTAKQQKQLEKQMIDPKEIEKAIQALTKDTPS